MPSVESTDLTYPPLVSHGPEHETIYPRLSVVTLDTGEYTRFHQSQYP